jgi:hypothetical protein
MTADAARQRLIDIAARDVCKLEVTRNQAPWIKPYWPDTDYPVGYAKRAPYCAAACVHWLATWGRELAAAGELRKTVGMSLSQFERWRCKSAGAWRWLEWADKRGVLVLSVDVVPLPGDFMVFEMSHIGLVDKAAGQRVQTIEANTGSAGGRDGDGCWGKDRERSLARAFIRIVQ